MNADEYSHLERLIEKDLWVIALIRGEGEGGRSEFHYVAMKGVELREFKAKFESGEEFNPEDYGVIIDSGEGEPSNATKTRIIRSFGLTQVS